MVSIISPGNDGTIGVCWGELKVNWNNEYHPYHTHEARTNMVTSWGKCQGISMT